MRRLRMRRALQSCVAATASAFVLALFPPAGWNATLVMILVGVAAVCGVSAVVLRFVEQPREIIVRAVEHAAKPPIMH